jgi:hypothetical protein
LGSVRRPTRQTDLDRLRCELAALAAVDFARPELPFRDRDIGDPLRVYGEGEVADRGAAEVRDKPGLGVIADQLAARLTAGGEDSLAVFARYRTTEVEGPMGQLNGLSIP